MHDPIKVKTPEMMCLNIVLEANEFRKRLSWVEANQNKSTVITDINILNNLHWIRDNVDKIEKWVRKDKDRHLR